MVSGIHDAELLVKCLKGGRLDTAEQSRLEFLLSQAGGALSCLWETVQLILQEHPYFPSDAQPWRPGLAVYEVPFLEKCGQGRLRIHMQQSSPRKPDQLKERAFQEFTTWDDAIGHYLNNVVLPRVQQEVGLVTQ